MKFFSIDVWCGKEIIFPDDTTWVLGEKLSESSCEMTKEMSLPPGAPDIMYTPNARAVFSCERKDGLAVKHTMKIYMQYDIALFLFAENISTDSSGFPGQIPSLHPQLLGKGRQPATSQSLWQLKSRLFAYFEIKDHNIALNLLLSFILYKAMMV
jgi:hypothetical protein